MKTRSMKLFFSFCFLLISFSSFSQAANKFYKQGKAAAEAGKIDEAINSFSEVLKQHPEDDGVWKARGEQYEKKKEYQKAIDDYTQSLNIKSNDEDLLLHVADLNVLIDNQVEALVILNKLIAKDKNNTEALKRKAWSQIKVKNFAGAVGTTDLALAREQYNFYLHYYKALAKDSLKDYQTACTEYAKSIALVRSIKPNDVKPLPVFKTYYTNFALAQFKVGVYDESIKNYTMATTLDAGDTIEPKNYRIFYERSFPYLLKSDFTNAIGDLNKAIVMNGKDKEPIYQRGVVYKKTNQYQSAISDFTAYIQLDDKNAEAFGNRARCYVELSNYKEAIKDLKKAIQLANKEDDVKLLAEIKQKLYEANREADIPELKIDYPFVDVNDFTNIVEGQFDILVEGRVRDKSQIEYIKINGIDAIYNNGEDDYNPDFKCKIPITTDLKKLDIVVSDVYHNTITKTIKVGRVINDSRVRVTFAGKILSDDESKMPYGERQVYLVNDKGEIFFAAKTDIYGRFKFENIPYDQPYFLTMDVKDTPLAEKTKFIVTDDNNVPVLVSKEDGKERFKFEILPSDYNSMSLMTVDDAPLFIDIKGKLIAGNESKTPLANITVILMNGKGEMIASKKTDTYGLFIFSKLVPKEDYTLKTDSAESQTISYNKILVTDEKGKIIKELTKNPYGYFKYELLQADKVQLTKITETDPWLKALKLSKDKNELKIIENIYYASNAIDILPEAEVLINKAIEALKSNPKLTIEVQSHTDAIAGDEYNMDLSQRRANTVMAYMIAKGADKSRITAKGFGETQLINHCANDVECSEEEHRQNRRTVFKLNYIGN